MTAPDVEELRQSVVAGLQRTVDKLAGGYASPLRRQLRAEGDDYSAAVLCLGLGRIGGEETKVLPCALTLGLLEEMGRVFLGLEDASTIIDGWGMPRTLNAADALYALGRQVLLAHASLEPDARLEALQIYTTAARDFAEALHAAPEGNGALHRAGRALYPAAASFAALCCGLDGETRSSLADLAVEAAEAGGIEAAFVKASDLLLREA